MLAAAAVCPPGEIDGLCLWRSVSRKGQKVACPLWATD
jgi:hypothetical protein